MNEKLEKALNFAKGAHGKQRRKYTGEPYWNHCKNVADLVASVSDDEEIIQAALLHDTLEDTNVSYEDLVLEFGVRVADLVVEVTEVSKPDDGNRSMRKEIDRRHYARSSAAGATIKLADLIDNTKSIVADDMNFSRIYLPEKNRCLEVLRHGHPDLFKMAVDQLHAGLLKIGVAV